MKVKIGEYDEFAYTLTGHINVYEKRKTGFEVGKKVGKKLRL